MNHNKLKLKEILCAFKTKKSISIIVILSILVAAVACFATTYLTKNEYKANMQLLIDMPKTQIGNQSYMDQSALYKTEINTCTQILSSNDLVQKTINDIGSKETLKKVNKNLKIEVAGDSKIINITYKANTDSEAIDLVTTLKTNFITEGNKAFPGMSVKVVTTPIKNAAPLVNKNKAIIMYTIVGLVVGFIISIAVILLIECFDNTIKSKEELEKLSELPVLAVLPKSKER